MSTSQLTVRILQSNSPKTRLSILGRLFSQLLIWPSWRRNWSNSRQMNRKSCLNYCESLANSLNCPKMWVTRPWYLKILRTLSSTLSFRSRRPRRSQVLKRRLIRCHMCRDRRCRHSSPAFRYKGPIYASARNQTKDSTTGWRPPRTTRRKPHGTTAASRHSWW